MAGSSQRGRVLAERYELRDRLGTGGAGTVWRGHDRALDRSVAVKLLHADLADDPDAGARFRTEATAAAKLTHPNAVLVYDLGRDEGDDYLVMELVEGVNLADILTDGPLPAAVAATIGRQVASALGTAHEAGIVHRDVKPGNVLLTNDGDAKLADFGIARAFGAATARLTRTGMVLGTARYLAPEQLRDDPVDGRADVYALGLVLHEILTGQAPFGEGNPVEVAARRLNTPLPPIDSLVADVPPGLDEIIEWATRLEPRQRPADGAELARALGPFATAGAPAALAARIAAVPSRNTTPVASDRIDPVGPAPLDLDAPLDPHADATPEAQPRPSRSTSTDGDATGDETPGGEVGATRAITTSGGTLGSVPSVGQSPPEAPSGEHARARDITSEIPTDHGAAPAEAADDAETAGRRSSGGGPPGARRWVLAAGALAAIAAVAIGFDRTAPSDPSGDDATASPTPGGGADSDQPLAIAAAGDHDPDGDQSERNGDVPLAHDGDSETYWPTETYNSADFGGFDKAGVGVWFELEEPTALDRVEVELSDAGGSIELWASADGPPSPETGPDDWGTRLGDGEVPATQLQFPNLPEAEVRTVLVWFTDLPDAGSGFRGEIREVRILAR
ncbi:MAG: protein kinase [Nitriliruptor sp.]